MGATKGWIRESKGKKRIEWYSKIGGYSLKLKEQDGTYLVTYGSLNNYKRFGTQKEAFKSAIKYMKAHPRG